MRHDVPKYSTRMYNHQQVRRVEGHQDQKMDSSFLGKMLHRVIKNGFKNGASVIFQQQRTIFSSAAVISVMVLISALLGLVRKRLYAGILAAGPDYDTLVAAFRIPDLVFQLLVAGSLNAAFIPLFSRYIVTDKPEGAWKFASLVLNFTLVFFVFLSALGMFFAFPLSQILAPGFSFNQQVQLAHLMRVVFLSPILLGVSSFVGGMVQSFKRFLIPFFSPVVYNLGAIFGILFLYPLFGLSGMAWGIVLGSFLHLLVQLPLLRHLGFRYLFCFSWREPALRELLRLALPRTIWAVISEAKEIIVVRLASMLAAGSISVLDYGQAVVRFPVSIFGASIAQAALPSLSEQVAKGNLKKFRSIFVNSLLQIIYILAPVSVVFIILKIPLVRLVFGTGNFSWSDTLMTSWVVALFSLSLLAQAGKELVVRGFYALRDSDTPVIVGVFSLCLGLVLAVILIPRWGVRGIVLGLSFGFLVEFGLLLGLFLRKAAISLGALLPAVIKIFVSSVVMAAAVYFPVKILDQIFIDTRLVVNLVVLVWVVLTFGGSVYLLLTWFLGCKQIEIFFLILLKLKNWREVLTSFKDLSPQTIQSIDGEESGGID
ncbi:murein biosynthesis integral membrane protein MurJ [candidate division CPR3 bacterium 4484_211]|uniref:Probable lipid II flippase MurJ n=1 Tax=candidate division CPR3 bacterium 4484_211 TaxID=1968527 RepID=A0A1W9NYM9_UNCC3|nr:MAG: murein biosynthesis integral membrane protein MurJ [candidate division CPR3 bacterium 4484_211]